MWDLHSKILEARLTSRSKFYHFYALAGKFYQIMGWRAPTLGLAPLLGNHGSVPAKFLLTICKNVCISSSPNRFLPLSYHKNILHNDCTLTSIQHEYKQYQSESSKAIIPQAFSTWNVSVQLYLFKPM